MMKLVRINPKSLKLSPKRFFSKKHSKSDPEPTSFGSGTTSSSSSSSSSDLKAGLASATPTSVLPETSRDFSDFSGDLGEAFRLMDRHKSGVVSREELAALLSRLAGAGEADLVAAMLSEVDDDGEGDISVEAIVSRVGSACAGEPAGDSELREVFEFFDADRDGKISAEELLGFFAAMGDGRCTLEDCRRMIAGVDANGDGFVCFADFSRMMDFQR